MSESTPLVSIRPAEIADAPAIEAIERASFTLPGERFSPKRIQYLIERAPRADVLVAERDGRIVGWAAGFVWLRSDTPWGRIYAIATDPKARGIGVGRRLMERTMEVLASRGAARLFLEVRADNAAALGLYRKLGFRECRTLPHYYAIGVPGLRMVRDVIQ